MLVPTVDTIRHQWIISALINNDVHVIVNGETGTSKTFIIKNILESLTCDEKLSMSIEFSFSARTKALQVQNFITSKMIRRKKGVLGIPNIEERIIIFVDDLYC